MSDQILRTNLKRNVFFLVRRIELVIRDHQGKNTPFVSSAKSPLIEQDRVQPRAGIALHKQYRSFVNFSFTFLLEWLDFGKWTKAIKNTSKK